MSLPTVNLSYTGPKGKRFLESGDQSSLALATVQPQPVAAELAVYSPVTTS